MRTAVNPVKRFNQHIEKDGDCLIWNSAKVHDGYGLFFVNGKTVRAHRYAYEVAVGAIPKEKILDHTCRNRACVNTDHLEPVTIRENTLRGNGITAKNARKTHCHRGHLLSGDNLYFKNGSRYCKECKRVMKRKHN